jgi:hypothetical protein
MKHALLLLCLIAVEAQAQCTFTPTITPDPAVICPGSFLSLETQAYDSYQWFENGQPITDQTSQVVQVDNASVGNSFTVECTMDGCTEMSAPVVLDGWVFLPPSVILAGQEPVGTFEGTSFFCWADTALLILGLPYDTNIQWTNNGTPIPGGTNDTLVVTTDGNYSVSGAPAQCPGYVQDLVSGLGMSFYNPGVPPITLVGNQLCTSITGPFNIPSWYLNGEPIGSGTCITPTVAGTYTVIIPTKSLCPSLFSEPYEFVPTGITDHNTAPELLVRPNPASTEVTIASSVPLNGPWRLMDAAGREVHNGRFSCCTNCALDLSTMESGNYLLEMRTGGERIVRKVVKE